MRLRSLLLAALLAALVAAPIYCFTGREQVVTQRLEAESGPSLNSIPDPMPASTVKWCREQMASDVPSEVSDLDNRCEAIELAAEGKIAGGVYTDQELATAMKQAGAAQ